MDFLFLTETPLFRGTTAQDHAGLSGNGRAQL